VLELLALNAGDKVSASDIKRILLTESTISTIAQMVRKIANIYPEEKAAQNGFFIKTGSIPRPGIKPDPCWTLELVEQGSSREKSQLETRPRNREIPDSIKRALDQEGATFQKTNAGRLLIFLGENYDRQDITYEKVGQALRIPAPSINSALAILIRNNEKWASYGFKVIKENNSERTRVTHVKVKISLEILPNEVIPFEPFVFQERIQKLREVTTGKYGRKMLDLLEEVALAYRQVCAEEDVLPMKVRDLAIKLKLSHGLIKKMIEELLERREALGICVEIIIKGPEHILVPRMLRFMRDDSGNALEKEKDEVESREILRRDKNRIKVNLQLASQYRRNIIEKAMNIMRKKSSQHDLLELVKTSAEDFLFTFVVFKFDPDQHPQGDAGF
jgi:hypothetical protein